MLMENIILLNELKHPALVNFKGINLYNNKIKFFEEEEDDDEEEESEKKFSANPTLFFELPKNKSLGYFIYKKQKLPPVKRQICMIGLAAAVEYIHRKGKIHNCLDPNVVWLDENYYPKLLYFFFCRTDLL